MEYQTIVKPDGTIEIVPVDTSQQDYPFRSMAEMDQDNRTFFEEFTKEKTLPASVPFQFPTNVQQGISTFGGPEDVQQGFVKGSESDISFPPTLGIDTSFGVANEPDEEEQETNQGIAKLFEFLGNLSPLKFITKGIGTLFNPKGSDMYMPSKFGIGQFSAADLNRMNALGGYYSEPARAQRRARNRVANLLKRKSAGKNYSEKNLQELQDALSGSASMANYASPELASRSSKVGVSGFKAGDDIREQASTSSKYGF